MRRTRWKLAAGALGLSLCGLAAIADVPARTGMISCVGTPQVPEPPVPLPPPVAQNPAPLPILPAPTGNVVTPGDLPTIPPAPPAVILVTSVEMAPMPRTPPQVFDLPVPAVPTDAALAQAPMRNASPLVFPPVQPETTLPPIPPQANDLVPAPIPPQAPPPPTPSPAATEKKLKVMLHMGDDRPRFEVRDGEEVYLKVVCERVDVKSPSDRGETMSILRATGSVMFMTPGGEGMCEELSVVPGTGQVIVNGKVAFKYNWGKVETTVSGERMTFRLGSTPGMAPPTTPATVPASFNRRQ